jgi:hypothetical protein
MAINDNDEPHDRLAPLLTMLGRVSSVVGSIIASRTTQLVAIRRNELRRAATVIALAFTAAILPAPRLDSLRSRFLWRWARSVGPPAQH